jgi:RHS repeat-associated protein
MGAGGTADTAAAGSVISLPKGGGAVHGLGETFAPDLFTGTGNFTVPIAVPAGRRGVAPSLSLAYSTGTGNGPFGLGWRLSLPGVSRKTSHGVPRYLDGGTQADVFLLSGAEDLVPVAGSYPGRVRYRPRTEGLFARIEHVKDPRGDFWEVRTRDGLRTRYGTPRPAAAPTGWRDPAVVADPDAPDRVFAWRITETVDPLGNLIRYEYLRDAGPTWDQPLISRISYADYGDRTDPSFLVTVEFAYSSRPDPFTERRSGFEIRTSLRCDTVLITTHAADGVARVAREYRLEYAQAPFNGVSLLAGVTAVGVDGTVEEALPPLTFEYARFEPAGRRFEPVTGSALPTAPLSDPTLTLVDLRGVGLPDLVELGAVRRFWRNAGDGRFELPRMLGEAPPFPLGDGVRLMDADGDGRPDLFVGQPPTEGYFPMTFAGTWSRRSFQPYRQVPAVPLSDANVKLIDLDGDGLTDVLRSGTGLEAWFNDRDPRKAWQRTALDPAMSVDLSDPRIRLADMTGDGLSDIVLLRSGNVAYWPNLGHGRWGAMVTMRRSPRLPDGYDPRRVLLGDVDGDGAADLVYVDNGRVLLWGNQSGNGWTDQPVVVPGTPTVADIDAIQLADLHGTGMGGLLFSRAADGSGRPHLRFLDFTGAVKPYLLTVMDNHLGARTTVHYRPSTVEYLRDAVSSATRWRTTLPFPVHVVGSVEVNDQISGGRLTTEYRYHHGYWDGVEREYRGFAMVEHLDTETFDVATAAEHFSPPTLTKSWFHPGPVAAVEAGDWTELDLRHEYWPGDAPLLSRPAEVTSFLAGLSRSERRTALRALRGQLLRTELYAVDGNDRPYTVTESVSGVRSEAAGVYFPFAVGQRTTQWERGTEPMTRFAFPAGYDPYGQPTAHLDVAVPRVSGSPNPQPYLATYGVTEFARRDDADHYLVDRVARATSYEVVNDGRLAVADLLPAVLAGAGSGLALRLIGHTRTHYDGLDFEGLPLGVLGEHGLPVRVESLAFTDGFLRALFDPRDPQALGPQPPYLTPGSPLWSPEYPQQFRDLLPELAGYRHYADTDVPGSPGGYFVVSARHRYNGRGLPVASLDPFGAASTVDYDQHDLLPVRATDPAGLTIEAVHDFRILQPRQTTDANGNTASVTYSPSGLVTAHFVRGKNGEGDNAAPSTTLSYDLRAFAERGQPASVRSVRRVHHDTDTGVPPDTRDEVHVSVEYSDGFGRLLQTRTQAEDTLFGDPTFGGGVIPIVDLAPVGDTVGRTRAPSDPDNVVVSGWQVYDNKGRVVHKYEPFFGTGYDYTQPGEAQLGQRVTMFYDPRGQVIRTRYPDGSEQLVIFGIPADLAIPSVYTPTPWESYTYDANDNAGRTHGDTAGEYRDHWNTPASIELDALGRTVRAVARNGTESLTTRSAYDIQGNLLSIVDPLGRQAFTYRYDLARRRWRVDSIDAGRRDSVPDALGSAVEGRDGKGALVLATLDRLRRPGRVWARDGGTAPVTLRQMVEYGDGGTPDQPPAKRAAARALNLLGRPIRHNDEAGLVVVAAADFKGNVLESTRRVIADAPILATYATGASNGWQVTPFQVDWTPAPGQTQDAREAELLEPTGYTTTTSYDALNRVVLHQLPSTVDGHRPVARPTYDRAGALLAIDVDGTAFVQRIARDAKGRRALIALGNGVMTRYAYDPHTLRLARLRSEHYTLSAVDGLTYHPIGVAIQDCGYVYDLVGNILATRDRAPGSGIPNNSGALGTSDPVLRRLLGSGDALNRQFTYDPVYRLLSATGREFQTPPGGDPWIDLPRGTDPTNAQAYTESYGYDPAGNLLSLAHAGTGGFTRTYTAAPGSNRLQRMTIGKTRYDYTYDAAGNMLSESTSRHYSWSDTDRLRAFATQVPGAEPSVHAQYLYDAAGQRVKKLVRRQGGASEVTHYVDGAFEHHRWTGGQNNHIHVMDDKQRVALVRVGPAHPDDRGPAVAYHLADHLGSSVAVLDDTGALTNREEYTPYGETSFGSFTRKRYRFTGQERDEESSLAYHSARYYAPWLARWTSRDPAGADGGHNAFAYADGNPLKLMDPSGQAPEKPDQLPRDAKGNYQLPGEEVIEVNDTKPDELAIQESAGNSEFKTMAEHERQLTLAIEQAHLYSLAEREQAWRADPAGAWKAWHEYVTSTHARERQDKAGELAVQQRRMNTNAMVGKGIAVVAGVAVGGAALFEAVGAAVGSTTLNMAAAKTLASAKAMLALSFAYGALAPAGAPDLPGPADDLGRGVRSIFSTANKIVGGSRAPVTGEVIKHATKILEHLRKVGEVSKNLQGMLRPGKQMTAKVIDRILEDAYRLTKSRGYLGDAGPSFDWLINNFLRP